MFFSCIGTKSAQTDPRSQDPSKCLKIHGVLRIKTRYTNQSTLHEEGRETEGEAEEGKKEEKEEEEEEEEEKKKAKEEEEKKEN